MERAYTDGANNQWLECIFIMSHSDYISHILKNLPHNPGVYKMKNKDGDIIYVG